MFRPPNGFIKIIKTPAAFHIPVDGKHMYIGNKQESCTISQGVNVLYLSTGFPLYQKQEMSKTASYLETDMLYF
jgi:hypothetical protein